MAEVKKRRIKKQDWDEVEKYILTELEDRKRNEFRKDHEMIWKEVDRQVRMDPLDRQLMEENSNDSDWHNVVEVGELAKISEVLSADVRRITFPNSRSWFETHIKGLEPDEQLDQDRQLRALMVQQHQDFGLKARVDLSVKEALHHGSFVAEVTFEQNAKVHKGTGIENVASPVWTPHSMWNCYPDSTNAIIGSNMFYNGSMIIRSFLPKHKFKAMAKGKGWMPSQIRQALLKKKGDVEILTYYGDLSIQRQDGEILLLNSKAVLANEKIVFHAPNKLPYSPVIFSGYERIDVRDPYYISPVMKLSPMQSLATHAANKLMDALDLKNEPPLIYDASDPDYVRNGGPDIFPGAKTGTRGSTDYEVIQVGDPTASLASLEFVLLQLQSGSGVDAARSGGGASGDKTATEVRRTAQSGEIRTIDFIGKLEDQGLRPFLYFQHELNKMEMQPYSFFNPEVGADDFNVATKKDLPKFVHFDIVGSKGVLGEEERTEKTAMVTSFLMGNEKTAHIPNMDELAREMYEDAGNRNAERLLNTENKGNPELEQFKQEAEQAISELQGQLQEAQSGQEIEMAKIQSKENIELAKIQADQEIESEKIAVNREKLDDDMQLGLLNFGLEEQKAQMEFEFRDKESKEEPEDDKEVKSSIEEVSSKLDDISSTRVGPISVKYTDGKISSIVTPEGERRVKRNGQGRIVSI